MTRNIFYTIFLLMSFVTTAQFSDDFSDGDLTQNPSWQGDTQLFTVQNQVLWLNAGQAGNAWLSTPSRNIHNTQWEFWVRLAFTPSNNNHPRIYLVSDNADLSAPLNGYYIRIGRDGTDNKRIYFFKQSGETHTELLAGYSNIANKSNNLIRIKVIRDETGNWEILADPNGGIVFKTEGTIQDQEYTTTEWFGIRCFYTSSNADRFYFDDFYVGDILTDTISPEVKEVLVTSSNTLEVIFTEAVEPETAQNITYYFVNKGIGGAFTAIQSDLSPQRVSLSFANDFIPGEIYNLTVANVKDLAGNIMPVYMGDFYWYQPTKFDVVFNELMINPTPEVGLPPFEYIEFYNTSDFDIKMDGWTFQYGASQRQIPSAEIPSKGYLVLTHAETYSQITEIDNIVVVPDVSATALTNSGNLLILLDQNLDLISWVRYTDQWYGNPSKANGGWSIEKIDPYNFCEEASNWKASVDPRGGSPGDPNSILGINPDITHPSLLRIGYAGADQINLFFNEPMDPTTLSDVRNFIIDNSIGQPIESIPAGPDNKSTQLLLPTEIQSGKTYQLSTSTGITDCAGNSLPETNLRFGKPEMADSLDLVINEILFNPPERGVRYIELYNRSNKIVDLKDYILSSMDTIENVLTSIKEISAESLLFFPGEYLVLTPDPDIVKSQYMTNNPGGFVRTTLPSMTNTNGIVVLASKGQQIADMLIYDEKMHYALLTTNKGVSLERISYDRFHRGNWHSAASTAGFGTPGYKNSQFKAYESNTTEVFEIFPDVFSPDNDGVDDVLHISYQMQEPGYTANISIYDSRGRLTRTLLRSALTETHGIITWDGITDDSQKADIGIYIIFIELFEPGGTVKTIKKTCVLGGRL
jgi:hypothetical protein